MENSFDAEDDAVDEIVGGWKMAATSVGAVARRDPRGLSLSLSLSLSSLFLSRSLCFSPSLPLSPSSAAVNGA